MAAQYQIGTCTCPFADRRLMTAQQMLLIDGVRDKHRLMRDDDAQLPVGSPVQTPRNSSNRI